MAGLESKITDLTTDLALAHDALAREKRSHPEKQVPLALGDMFFNKQRWISLLDNEPDNLNSNLDLDVRRYWIHFVVRQTGQRQTQRGTSLSWR